MEGANGGGGANTETGNRRRLNAHFKSIRLNTRAKAAARYAGAEGCACALWALAAKVSKRSTNDSRGDVHCAQTPPYPHPNTHGHTCRPEPGLCLRCAGPVAPAHSTERQTTPPVAQSSETPLAGGSSQGTVWEVQGGRDRQHDVTNQLIHMAWRTNGYILTHKGKKRYIDGMARLTSMHPPASCQRSQTAARTPCAPRC
jgi:hypothetical protein